MMKRMSCVCVGILAWAMLAMSCDAQPPGGQGGQQSVAWSSRIVSCSVVELPTKDDILVKIRLGVPEGYIGYYEIDGGLVGLSIDYLNIGNGIVGPGPMDITVEHRFYAGTGQQIPLRGTQYWIRVTIYNTAVPTNPWDTDTETTNILD